MLCRGSRRLQHLPQLGLFLPTHQQQPALWQAKAPDLCCLCWCLSDLYRFSPQCLARWQLQQGRRREEKVLPVSC